MALIIYDHRERKSEVVKALANEKNIELRESSLLSSDYIIQTKVDDKVVEVGIERKTIPDFLNSIIDKRLLNQLINLKENFNYPILILEGEENIFALRNFHPNSIRGMITSIALDFQVPMIFTKGAKDTAAYINVIAKRFDRGLPRINLRNRKPLTLKEQQEYFIEGLQGIGNSTAKNLLEHFKNVKNIVNADKEELIKVEKIGKKKAEKIKEVFEKEYN